MKRTWSITSRLAVVVLAAAAASSAVTAQVNVQNLSDDGWFSDDTRADGTGTQGAGSNLISPLLTDDPEATASGNAAHDADIFGQIMFGAAPGTVPAGTWDGAVRLYRDPAGAMSGKTQISHRKNDGVGFAPGSAVGPGFTAEYSWMGNGDVSMTPSLKFGIKTAEFGSTPASSRTGENVWDKVLIYEPGNLNGGLSNGVWDTETISHTSGKWWFFDRTVSAGIIGTPMTLSAMNGNATTFSGAKTIGQVYALITAPGAHITSVQFGIGSGGAAHASVYVNQLKTSAYLSNAKVTFGANALAFDQNATNNAIFGGGNTNGSYTMDRSLGIELGLRGKLRFNALNLAENTYNSNHDGTYTFNAGAPTAGAPWVAATTPFWNVEWSVNTNHDGSSGLNLDDLTYKIGMDFDAGPGAQFLEFDPIAANSLIPFSARQVMPFWDNSIGTNATAQGGGAEAANQGAYLALLAANNLAQNSWSPEFFNEAPFNGFNPQLPGRYEFYLAASLAGDEVARTHITIVVVPPQIYDQNVTSNYINGSGSNNGSFAVSRLDGLELGLRGKLRFNALNLPENTFNSNGDGTYTFDTGAPTGGAGYVTPNTPRWNFEWSVNTNYDGSQPARKLDDLTYRIRMDFDASADTNFLVFDHVTPGSTIPFAPPVVTSFWDHSIGDNTTAQSGGAEATSAGQYTTLLAGNNLAQNSWNMEFFNDAPFNVFNPNTPGRYEFELSAYNGATEVGRTAMTIVVTSGSSLTLEADDCQSDQVPSLPGVQVVVDLHARNLASNVGGYQAFLSFDHTKMTYVGSASSYTALPFPTHVQSIGTANVGLGKLRLDGSVPIMSGGFTTADSHLAHLVFTVMQECVPVQLDFDLTQPFPSELSYLGVPVATALVNSGPIVPDATAPVIGPAANHTVAADASVAGGCTSAVVTFPTPEATDNCGDVTVQCFPPSGTAFPAGQTTTVVVLATDECGNTATSTFTVTVTSTNVVQLQLQLFGVSTATVRCIRFKTSTCSATVDIPIAFNAAGHFTGTVEVPCGNWLSLCAKDRQHTQWATVPLGFSMDGTQYVAGATLTLKGGDTDDDGDVDIHDVTWFISQFGGLAANGGCPWNGTRDADFSNNGAVLSEDYSFLVQQWLTTSSCSCTLTLDVPHKPASLPGKDRPAASQPVHDTVTAAADLNRDGVVDHADVRLFEAANGLPNSLSEAMLASSQSGK